MDFGALQPLTNVAKQFLPGRDTDAVDRLNSYITPCFFVFAAVIVAGKQWIGEPLQCWLEPKYNGFEEQYIERYCFINGTYFVPMNNSIPAGVQAREDAKLAYYQWIPIVLALQALLSGAPLKIWRSLSPKSGINLKHAIRMAIDAIDKYDEERKKAVQNLAEFVNYSFGLQRFYRQNKTESRMSKCLRMVFCWVPFVGSKYGNYLPGFYLFFKLLTLGIAITQLFIFNAFLDSPTRFFALDFTYMFNQGLHWNSTGLFPRVTLCDFVLYTLGNQPRHTVQCVLSINFLVEKIYLFLWFWMLFLCIITTINLIVWLERIVFDRAHRTFVTSYLKVAVDYKKSPNEDGLIYNFVKNYLCDDGVFLLRLISFNVGIPITASLINDLLTDFSDRLLPNGDQEEKKRLHTDSDNEDTSFADV